jgi:two-component system, OmpR family, alkaline phosphatase synthesis response regulator PhoP
MKNYKILVVDDEEDLCEILKFNLENEGFSVDVANSAEEALKLRLKKYDLLLLDIMMGKMSGFRLAEVIRKERKLTVPIVFLTAKDTENDTLTGFSLGADDYIAKPFSVRQVIARVKAVLKRTRSVGREEENINVHELEIDVNSKLVSLHKKPIELTKKEFEILRLLIENQDRIFSREDIMERIWESDVIVDSRTVDVHITRLRKKLENYSEMIVSRKGYGYSFNPEKAK